MSPKRLQSPNPPCYFDAIEPDATVSTNRIKPVLLILNLLLPAAVLSTARVTHTNTKFSFY